MYKNKNKILNGNYDILYIHGIPLSFPLFGTKAKVINHIHGMTNPFLKGSFVHQASYSDAKICYYI